jgi:hypothetical protein
MTRGREPAMASLLFVVEDYQRLWAVTGFADRFALRLARPGGTGPGGTGARPSGTGAGPGLAGDPYDAVLGEHHRRLVAMLRAGGLAGDRGPDELANALTGFYLSRRLTGARLEGWAPAAIRTIMGRMGAGGGDR